MTDPLPKIDNPRLQVLIKEEEAREITDTMRLDQLDKMIAASTSLVILHDNTPDWSTVLYYDDEEDPPCRGRGVRGALDALVKEFSVTRALRRWQAEQKAGTAA